MPDARRSDARTTEAVSIRPYAPEDLALLVRLLGDPAMTVHLGGPHPHDALVARHQRYLESDGISEGVFTITLGEQRRSAGWIGFWESVWDGEPVWECGWHVLPECQGRGVAHGAAVLMIAEAAARRRHHAMHAFPSVDNEASNALCLKLGFVLLGKADVEYPKGHLMHSNNWRLDLSASEIASPVPDDGVVSEGPDAAAKDPGGEGGERSGHQ